jgi:small-conductance mechanosensitive channel
MDITNLLAQEIFGYSLLNWLVAGAVAVLVFLAVRVALGFVVSRLQPLSERTEGRIDGLIVRLFTTVNVVVVAMLSLFAGVATLPGEPAALFTGIAAVALFVQVGLWGNQLIAFWLEGTRNSRDGQMQAAALGALGFVGQLVLWSVVVLLSLDNLGFDVTALVASLGIGGVAVGLAVQNILGDLFSSLAIIFDKPFRVGDFIMVDSDLGTVEHVGLKTTRVKSLSGEQLVFANSDLVKSRIHNFGLMQERRVPFTLGVTYQTTYQQLREIPEIVREIIEAQDHVRFDRAHFQGFGNFSLHFEIVYYVIGSDYNRYMDIQQAINLEIVRRFADAGIEFAYPTQSLYIEQARASVALQRAGRAPNGR